MKYGHSWPRKSHISPHTNREVAYGEKEQLITEEEKSPPLDNKYIKLIQGIAVLMLYYAISVDIKLLVNISYIGSQQATAT